MSDMIDCQTTVERMLTDGPTLAEVEEYVECCAPDEMEKAGIVDPGLGAPRPGDTTDTCHRNARARHQHAKPN